STRKARTLDFMRRVSDIFEHDPSRAIRDVTKELDVSHVTPDLDPDFDCRIIFSDEALFF
ncbi:Hypothetical protein FKW44_022389, partial [Caligus rogercresseyi]